VAVAEVDPSSAMSEGGAGNKKQWEATRTDWVEKQEQARDAEVAKDIKPVEGSNYEQLFGKTSGHDVVVPKKPEKKQEKPSERGFDEYFGGSVTVLDAAGEPLVRKDAGAAPTRTAAPTASEFEATYSGLTAVQPSHAAAAPGKGSGFDEYFGGAATVATPAAGARGEDGAPQMQRSYSEPVAAAEAGPGRRPGLVQGGRQAAVGSTHNAGGHGWGSGGTFVDGARGAPLARTSVIEEEPTGDASTQTGAQRPGVKVKVMQGVGLIVRSTLKRALVIFGHQPTSMQTAALLVEELASTRLFDNIRISGPSRMEYCGIGSDLTSEGVMDLDNVDAAALEGYDVAFLLLGHFPEEVPMFEEYMDGYGFDGGTTIIRENYLHGSHVITKLNEAGCKHVHLLSVTGTHSQKCSL